MLTADETRTLDRLVLRGGQTSPVGAAGVRQARARGFGLEFQDYRVYQPGDDPRSIDWTVEARLRQLVVRVCHAEAHLRLHLLVDVSGSMGLGTPTKLACATKLAAALCYLAVERRDSVGVATFDRTIGTYLPPSTGRRQVFRVFEVLGGATAAGRSRIDSALSDFAGVSRGGGLAIVLSDFFQPEGVLTGLEHLRYCGLTPGVLQVVAPEELQPVIDDEVELVDVEDPGSPGVSVDAAAVTAYQQRVAGTSADLAAFCAERGLPWARVHSSTPFDDLVQVCIHAGLLAGYA